jgi:hypothetical protein
MAQPQYAYPTDACQSSNRLDEELRGQPGFCACGNARDNDLRIAIPSAVFQARVGRISHTSMSRASGGEADTCSMPQVAVQKQPGGFAPISVT